MRAFRLPRPFPALPCGPLLRLPGLCAPVRRAGPALLRRRHGLPQPCAAARPGGRLLPPCGRQLPLRGAAAPAGRTGTPSRPRPWGQGPLPVLWAVRRAAGRKADEWSRLRRPGSPALWARQTQSPLHLRRALPLPVRLPARWRRLHPAPGRRRMRRSVWLPAQGASRWAKQSGPPGRAHRLCAGCRPAGRKHSPGPAGVPRPDGGRGRALWPAQSAAAGKAGRRASGSRSAAGTSQGPASRCPRWRCIFRGGTPPGPCSSRCPQRWKHRWTRWPCGPRRNRPA